MDGPVDAGIHIVGRYQSSEEADAVAPAALIDECAPDECGVLFRRAADQARHNDGEESSECDDNC